MKFYLKKKYILSVIILILLIIGGVFAQKSGLDDSVSSQENVSNNEKKNYLFVISWSPAYCAERDPQGTQLQCSARSHKKYRFIVHGLWPQSSDKTQHLNYCRQISAPLEAPIIEYYFDMMPSSSLMQHQWRKHGSCSDLTSRAYFAKMKTLYDTFKIPTLFSQVTQTHTLSLEGLLTKISQHVPTIKNENIIISCKKNQLKEVRFCLDSNYNPRKCLYQEVKSGRCRKNAPLTIRF